MPAVLIRLPADSLSRPHHFLEASIPFFLLVNPSDTYSLENLE